MSGEKVAENTGSPKALYVLVVIIGLLIAAGLIYASWLALTTSPENPWEAFAISQAFLGFHDAVFEIGALLWIFGTLLFALELAGFTLTRRGFPGIGWGYLVGELSTLR